MHFLLNIFSHGELLFNVWKLYGLIQSASRWLASILCDLFEHSNIRHNIMCLECLIGRFGYTNLGVGISLLAHILENGPSLIILAELVELFCITNIKRSIVRSTNHCGRIISFGHNIIMTQQLSLALYAHSNNLRWNSLLTTARIILVHCFPIL